MDTNCYLMLMYINLLSFWYKSSLALTYLMHIQLPFSPWRSYSPYTTAATEIHPPLLWDISAYFVLLCISSFSPVFDLYPVQNPQEEIKSDVSSQGKKAPALKISD